MTSSSKNSSIKQSTLIDLQEKLGYSFVNLNLLTHALRHPSAASSPLDSNQRLEFFGDRILGLFVAEFLFEMFPNEPEGALAKRFSALVKRDTLLRVSKEMDLDLCLDLSDSEIDMGGRENPRNLADAMESLIAAMYIDGGKDIASNFIRNHWMPIAAEEATPPCDPKTMLQEWAQRGSRKLPEYVVVSKSGPPHAPIFEVEVRLIGFDSARSKGSSKQFAEQSAAETMLINLNVLS